MPEPAGAGGLSARDVTVRLAGRRVLDHASLDVPRGRITALVAASGAGKSTLLRACVRLIAVETGAVTLDAVDVCDIDACALRRRVGLVAQHPVMLPGTVTDNLRHGLPHLPQSAVDRALDDAGLERDLCSRVARELSGGERARVGLARALTRGPELLLLDEPTAALDNDAADRIGSTLKRLRASGLGLCVATHDLDFAERYADRVATLGPP